MGPKARESLVIPATEVCGGQAQFTSVGLNFSMCALGV